MALLAPRDDERILDVGDADGEVVGQLARRSGGLKTTGVDLLAAMLAHARI